MILQLLFVKPYYRMVSGIRVNHRYEDKRVGRVRLLTQNAFIRPGPINHMHGDNKRARFEAMLHLTHKYDVVCLQELWGYYKRKQFSTRFPFIVTSPAPRGKTDGGLVILSRFPIVSFEFKPFLDTKFPDNMVHKGYLIAKIDTGSNQCLTVVNAHLQASYSKEFPKKQLKQLGDMYAHLTNTPNLVLCGDLNIDTLKPDAYRDATATLHPLKDSVPQLPTVTCVYDTATGKELSTTMHMCLKCALAYAKTSPKYTVEHQRLDHIWVAPHMNITHCNIVNTVLSDHLGVEATIELQG
jgi:endonuclease/exonuclease/phosphatase family metal-dependent hydrolase